ncbi:MAG: hybrid sensor histidine kinase/response regulator [Deltaproteobacteria bacterium]|nr:hybrid sensor histidine kinase/response regulator [Deltaproteobacteria bacterium]
MGKKANILVVDDEPGPRESLKMILKPHYNVYAVEKGEDATEILRQVPIDVVTVDLKMPGLHGTKVLEKVKQHDPDIEAIIITGYGSMDSAIDGLRLGAFDYVSKPFDVAQILALIRRALERRKAKLQLKDLGKTERMRAQKAEQANRLKRQLVSALAHDIKNPLGLITGYAELVLERLKNMPEANEDVQFLGLIQTGAQRITKLVGGFLDTARLEAGYSVVRTPVNLNQLIREVTQQQILALQMKHLDLSLSLDDRVPDILGDEAQIGRVLWNLVDNAVKFTPSGGKISVTSGTDRDEVLVEVKDTGIGIPQEELPHLFSEFGRLRGSRRIEGTGLGLFIVKTIVEAHGGKVSATSKEGEGTTFTLRFSPTR